jgi:hypothetical protein
MRFLVLTVVNIKITVFLEVTLHSLIGYQSTGLHGITFQKTVILFFVLNSEICISGSHNMTMKSTVFWDVTPCSLVEPDLGLATGHPDSRTFDLGRPFLSHALPLRPTLMHFYLGG